MPAVPRPAHTSRAARTSAIAAGELRRPAELASRRRAVGWTAPYDNGENITAYTLYTNASRDGFLVLRLPLASLERTLYELRPNTPYEFFVSANNSAGRLREQLRGDEVGALLCGRLAIAEALKAVVELIVCERKAERRRLVERI